MFDFGLVASSLLTCVKGTRRDAIIYATISTTDETTRDMAMVTVWFPGSMIVPVPALALVLVLDLVRTPILATN